MIQIRNGENFLFRVLVTAMSLLFSMVSFAEVEQIKKTLSQDELIQELKKTNDLSVEDFIPAMEKINIIAEEYVKGKVDECSGEFTSVILNDKGEKILKKKKLSKKERRHCLYMLINFRLQYTRAAFAARTKHMAKLQKHQLNELEKLSEKRVQELEKLLQKYKR